MIEYQLKDINGNTYDLNGDSVSRAFKCSLTPGEDTFEFDNRIVERSFLPGSSLIGGKRLRQKSLTLSLVSSNPDSNTYRAEINELLMWVQKTVWIVDVTNAMEIKVTADSASLGYNQGSYKLLSDNEIIFTALAPYWEDLTESSVAGTALATTIKEQTVDNQGFLPAYPVITLVASVATDDIQIYIDSDNTGIQIQDDIFGTTGNLTMVIDCELGKVTINDDDRNVSIVTGTGFFPIPLGEDVINILGSQEIDYTIEWKERYFI